VEYVAGFLVLERDDGDLEPHARSLRKCRWPPVEMGYLPALYGQPEHTPRDLAPVLSFRPSDILHTWSVLSGQLLSRGDGVFLEFEGDTAGVELQSPPMLLDPAEVPWLGVSMGTTSSHLAVQWTGLTRFREGCASVTSRVSSEAERRYLIQVGCVPAWAWAGSVVQLRLRWPEPGCRVRLGDVALLRDGVGSPP
jgi:hypothetical protein